MDAEAKAPVLWPPVAKSWPIEKDSDAGKDWRQEENGTTEDETVGWHHRLDGREFRQTPGDNGGQGSLVFCSPWGHKELNTTEQQKCLQVYWLYGYWGTGERRKGTKYVEMPQSSLFLLRSSDICWIIDCYKFLLNFYNSKKRLILTISFCF